MSTDLHPRPSPSTPPEADDPKPPRSSLSLTQVVGGALAAMTAAALGSRLSVAGTVVGAALASIVAAVAGALYTSSLRYTRDRASRVVNARLRNGTPTAVETVTETRVDAAAAPARPAAEEVTEVRPGGPDQDWVLPTPAATPARPAPRIRWKTIVVGALAIFAIAIAALTGFELVTGQAISGGQGTTVGQVSEGNGTRQPVAKPSASPSTTASPTATPSASATPSATPTAVVGPTETPSASATPTPSATPSVTPSQAVTPAAPSAPGAGVPSAVGRPRARPARVGIQAALSARTRPSGDSARLRPSQRVTAPAPPTRA